MGEEADRFADLYDHFMPDAEEAVLAAIDGLDVDAQAGYPVHPLIVKKILDIHFATLDPGDQEFADVSYGQDAITRVKQQIISTQWYSNHAGLEIASKIINDLVCELI